MTTTNLDLSQLPAPIRDFLAARTDDDADAAIRTFGPDAVVTDDGHTFRGTEQVHDFLRDAGSEFTYTTDLVGTERTDDGWVVLHHLEGDFPGGVVDLRYRFVLADGLIQELVIAP